MSKCDTNKMAKTAVPEDDLGKHAGVAISQAVSDQSCHDFDVKAGAGGYAVWHKGRVLALFPTQQGVAHDETAFQRARRLMFTLRDDQGVFNFVTWLAGDAAAHQQATYDLAVEYNDLISKRHKTARKIRKLRKNVRKRKNLAFEASRQ